MTQNPPLIGREILAANVHELMERVYIDCPNKPKALAQDAGCSLSSVQRVLSGSSGATVDTIERLAAALGVQPYQLFIPNLRPSGRRPAKTRG